MSRKEQIASLPEALSLGQDLDAQGAVEDAVTAPHHLNCPLLLFFQFGGEDPYIPRDQAELVAGAAEARADWEVHIHDDAGHAFDNWDAPMFSRPEPAKRAWAQTTDFLSRTLPST